MIMWCHRFIVNIFFIFNILLKNKLSRISEDDNAAGLPTLDDHQAPANEQNQDNHMDMEGGHIPGVDDTTLLSNVSDEFILPPISTTGKWKLKNRNYRDFFS